MKRGRRKGGNKDKVFGCDLVEHLTATSQEIPQVLRSCSLFIEEHGIVDGIYRLSGVSSNTQKLRSEFDSEGSPDLYKDVYLQDIHCVSSLCKAYFRELPNPLLTYQLYDHFAEAVAVQLEDERLVRIKDVLKELPQPNFRTLEFLMNHLVRMATFSDQTNMHARNLAIVWAPNLLRSKDIEASGFNGTAAFMEVRVQSIVVEFILTHVSQLFPELDSEPGPTSQRRKSLPSPSILSSQDDHFFKTLQYPGNMSPGDGPPQMRPYHAIIDGTDKRKGSLKGRKWKSIFNLGGRLHDPRKKKYAPKEKEKTSLRPAKSMDSLSSGAYAQEGATHSSSQISPLAMPPGPADSGSAGSGRVASGYAVTYRRTGGASVSMVSGGGGAQGTYRSLDPGAGANADQSQPLAQVTPSRAERRAGMHISGPFSVTVPLHITSGLALGVLQGGKAEAEAEEEEPKQGQNDMEQPKKDRQENADEKETELDESKGQIDKKTEILNDNKEKTIDNINDRDGEKEVKGEDKESEEAMPKEKEESGDKDKEDQCSSEEEEENEGQHATDRPSPRQDIAEEDYMIMKGGVIQCPERDGGQNESCNFLSQEQGYTDHELTLDFQDTFGFLDLMDMPTSNQLNEFSVEPPAFEMEEDEDEEKQSPSQSNPHTETSELNLPTHTSRPLSNKSHSLPYQSYSYQPVIFLSSDEDCYSGPSDDEESSDLDKDEYEDMFVKSLPSGSHFQGLSWACSQIIPLDSNSNVYTYHENQSECLNQTHTAPLDVQDPPPVIQSIDTEMTDSNDSQCLNEDDLSSVPLETEHFNLEEKNDGQSIKNEGEDKSGLEELGNVNQPIEEENEKMEITDSKNYSHKDSHSTEDESQEDTSFGLDKPLTTEEPSNNGTFETSCTTDPVINEEPANSNSQQESTESYSAKCETTIDVTSPELQTGQNKTENDELSLKAEIILHTNMQVETDLNELKCVVLSEEREVDEKGGEERDMWETEEKMIIQEENTESDCSEGEKNDEGPTSQVDVDTMENESNVVPQEEENKVEDVDVEKQKEVGDGGEENDQQMKEDDEQEETEAQMGTAELKEGSVPEEPSEEDDKLSEDGEEQQSEKEKDSIKEEKREDPSTSDRENPLRPPRMKKRNRERCAGLGQDVGRTVIISKHKVYQVKAVPVVPPKPQHSKITAFRQQFQQRDSEKQQKPIQPACTEWQLAERRLPKEETENEANRLAEIGDVAQNHEYHGTELEKGTGTDREQMTENKEDQVKKQLKDTKSCHILEGEKAQDREEQKQRRGSWDGGSFTKGGQKELDSESKKTSSISMCFDEAVARATGKRFREKESIERERFADLQWERSEQKEGLNQRKKEEEEQKTD